VVFISDTVQNRSPESSKVFADVYSDKQLTTTVGSITIRFGRVIGLCYLELARKRLTSSLPASCALNPLSPL
jgi:hypothetical protein